MSPSKDKKTKFKAPRNILRQGLAPLVHLANKFARFLSTAFGSGKHSKMRFSRALRSLFPLPNAVEAK